MASRDHGDTRILPPIPERPPQRQDNHLSFAGEASRRRVAYLPYIDGPRAPKNEQSPTPLYHYLQRLTG